MPILLIIIVVFFMNVVAFLFLIFFDFLLNCENFLGLAEEIRFHTMTDFERSFWKFK